MKQLFRRILRQLSIVAYSPSDNTSALTTPHQDHYQPAY